MRRLLPIILLVTVASAMPTGDTPRLPDRDPGADSPRLWLDVSLPPELEELGLKATGNEEVFLSFAGYIQGLLFEGYAPDHPAAELDAVRLTLWFLTGGADSEPVFHLPSLPELDGGTVKPVEGLGLSGFGGFVGPVEAQGVLDALGGLAATSEDDALRRYVRDLRRRIGGLAESATLIQLYWLAPISAHDYVWFNLESGADAALMDASRSSLGEAVSSGDLELERAVDTVQANLEDQAALYGLAREIGAAARTGDPGLTREALDAYVARLEQANAWRGGYPDGDYRAIYATFHRLPLYDWAHYAYAFAAVLFVLALAFKRPRIAWLGIGAAGLGFVAHTAYLVLRWFIAGHSPTSGMFEFLVLLSWCLVGAFLFYALRRDAHYTGLGVMALIFGLLALTVIADRRIVQQLMPALKSVWMTIHVGLTAVGEGFLGMGFLFAVLYLFKSCAANPELPGRLPPLGVLEERTYRSLLAAFPFYTAGGLVAGMIWAEEAWGAWWSWDPKETLALVVWLILVLFLHGRLVKGWKGRPMAWLALVPFLAAVFNLVSNLFIAGLHSYA
ncbi:MAG: c-type cytochrome biogenesis protein CcsB [Candidatus Coatesbacteria bacterium RBG_13_66_14]|uniref:C-type cytochrome biogenesis protein CcsB n=1 Tax=Candidatus Coatesbacteria bacterium RBG_13_66_14 TaxID=1817816 RepID=A0A1F5FFE0_9BACT|nr:MAG: c-type cytochrome biogenesis protein CcsB [Candidatus Coatesbacteria bacterium RBG_13_66_14]